MIKVSDLIQTVRLELGDIRADQQRWSDDLFIKYINEASWILARKGILRDKKRVTLIPTISQYELPKEALMLTKVVFNGRDLDIVSHDYMDSKHPYWYDCNYSLPRKIIFDKQNRRSFIVYPTPPEEGYEGYDLSLIAGLYGGQEDYGTITSGGSFESPFGVVTDYSIEEDTEKEKFLGEVTEGSNIKIEGRLGVITETRTANLGLYGVTTGIKISPGELICYYNKKPIKVSSIEDVIDFDEVYEFLYKFYLVGNALRNNVESQDRALGNENLQLFEGHLNDLYKDTVYDYGRNNHYQTSYNGGL